MQVGIISVVVSLDVGASALNGVVVDIVAIASIAVSGLVVENNVACVISSTAVGLAIGGIRRCCGGFEAVSTDVKAVRSGVSAEGFGVVLVAAAVVHLLGVVAMGRCMGSNARLARSCLDFAEVLTGIVVY